ncbi:MAG: fibronectin type III domain-containing protein [Candidatus Eisenbacteria bacterium]|nr:fibronectin type III domain-containing protein [Candidatus Eisenbacteria bacterium]
MATARGMFALPAPRARSRSSIPVRAFVASLALFALSCGDDAEKPTPPDTTPPASVQNLAAVYAPGRVTLGWTAPGDDGGEGRASLYDLRFAGAPPTESSWDSATVVPSCPEPQEAGGVEHVDLPALPEGTWHFALRTADEVPNWSGLSNVVVVTVLPPPDLLPPDAVRNLIVSSTTDHSATLSWTASGDDETFGTASAYDIRYATAEITAETWETATPVAQPPVPQPAGATESFTIDGLETGATYHFALKVADERPNWSALSNCANATIADVVPPATVRDLAAELGGQGSVTLRWTVPGDDGQAGRASSYDLRYSTVVIYEEVLDWSWERATPVPDTPAPGEPGSAETFTVTGLQPGTLYYFALRAFDESGNGSGLSNVITGNAFPWSLHQLTSRIESTWLYEPQWSPDGQEIAFAQGGTGSVEIYRISASGGAPVQLTSHPGFRSGDPTWSPDGSRIAFFCSPTEYPEGKSGDLRIMDAADGGNERTVIHADEGLWGCAWSPDGERIAYVVGPRFLTILTPTLICAISPEGGAPDTLFRGDYLNIHPAWSPDGRRMALVSGRDEWAKLWNVPAGGGIWVYLDGEMRVQCGRPTWSSDGSRIAYDRRHNDNLDIWLTRADGASAVPLIEGPARALDPSWSPDGSRIAFVSDRTGQAEIWILDLDLR